MDNPRLNLYFREIIYNNPSAKKGAVCGVFSYEALTVEEAGLGNLYLVGKISNVPKKQHKNYEFLLSVLTSVMKREFYSDPQKSTLGALESTLQSANIYLNDFAKKGHKEWIGNFHFVCFAFSKNSIHVGQTGDMLIYLFRKNTISNIAKKFSNKKAQPSKTFSNIASGSLYEEDKLIVATSDILDVASPAKIKELLYYPNTEQIFNYLKHGLKKLNCLACLILEAKSKIPIIKKEAPVIGKMSKPVGIDLEKILNLKLDYTNIPKYLLIFFLFLSISLSPYLVQKIYYEVKLKKVDNLIKRTREIISKSEVSLTYQNQFEAQGLLQQASAFMATVNSLLIKLPEKVKEKTKPNIESIERNLNTQQNSINNVVNISQLETIANLSKNTFTFNPQGILKLEEYLYLYELTSGFLYKIDLDDAYSPTLIFLSSKDTFKLGAVREGAVALLSNPDKIYIYGKSDNYNTYLLKPNLESTLHIKDMTNYENNLYFLDTENLNILKYVPEENSLIGTNWLKDQFKEDLVNAQSLTIDGSIYVSKADGTIVEYIQGRKIKEFKPNASPQITKGGQLFTQQNMKNIYFLDSENNRIIAANKQDQFTTQYVSNEFTSLTDFWITPDEKTIYVLDGLRIFKINI